MRELVLAAGTVVFSALHLAWYARVVALWLWKFSGGIRSDGRLTVYGTSDWAWTVPAHLPAGLAFHLGLGALGIPLLFAGSVVAGFAAAGLLLAGRGRRGWRLWLFLAGWAWVPVPAPVSWVWQWTVAY